MGFKQTSARDFGSNEAPFWLQFRTCTYGLALLAAVVVIGTSLLITAAILVLEALGRDSRPLAGTLMFFSFFAGYISITLVAVSLVTGMVSLLLHWSWELFVSLLPLTLPLMAWGARDNPLYLWLQDTLNPLSVGALISLSLLIAIRWFLFTRKRELKKLEKPTT